MKETTKTRIAIVFGVLVYGCVISWINSMSPTAQQPIEDSFTPVLEVRDKEIEKISISNPVVWPSISSFSPDFSAQKVCNAYKIYKVSLTSESRFNEKLSGVLHNKGAFFRKVGKENGIDPLFLASVAIHESGNGTSNLAKTKNNVCGIYDSRNQEYQSFKIVDDCIDFTGKLLAGYVARQLDTVERVQRVYCPIGADNDPKKLNGLWLEGVQNWMTRISGNELILYSGL